MWRSASSRSRIRRATLRAPSLLTSAGQRPPEVLPSLAAVGSGDDMCFKVSLPLYF